MADDRPLDLPAMRREITRLAHESPAERREAAERLAAAADPAAVAALKRAVNDPDMTVRYIVRRSLKAVMERVGESHSDPAAESDLAKRLAGSSGREIEEIEKLLADPDPKKRMSALKLVSVKRLREALPALLARLEIEGDNFVIATMVKVIGLVGDGAVLPVLSRLLSSDDPRVRANTVEGISYVHDNSKVALLEPLVRDPDNRIRANALMALHPIKEEFVVAALREMLASGEAAIRDSAVYVIERLDAQGRSGLKARFAEFAPPPDAPPAPALPAQVVPAAQGGGGADLHLREMRTLLLAVPRVDVSPQAS